MTLRQFHKELGELIAEMDSATGTDVQRRTYADLEVVMALKHSKKKDRVIGIGKPHINMRCFVRPPAGLMRFFFCLTPDQTLDEIF